MTANSSDLETEQMAMFAAIGKAIARWSAFELHLCEVFTHCMGPSYPIGDQNFYAFDNQAAGGAFYAVESFRGKLSLTDKALRSRLRHMQSPDNLSAEWKAVFDKASKQSKFRNRLAHWNVLTFLSEKTGRVRMVPPIKGYDFLDQENTLRNGYNVETVTRFAPQFDLLTEETRKLAMSLSRNDELREVFRQQALRMEQESHLLRGLNPPEFPQSS